MIAALGTLAAVLLFASAVSLVTIVGLALRAPVGEPDVSVLDELDGVTR